MKEFFVRHRLHFLALCLLILIAGVSGYYAEGTPPPTIAAAPAPITVAMRVEQMPEARIQLQAGGTVFTLMETLQKNGLLSFHAKDFGEALGMFIEEINGVPNTSERYWIYYVNNKKAAVGVSGYTLKPGDVIEWKYETEKDL